jgi:hypothetical protein
MVGDKFCVTGDHEVLTNDGWIRFDELHKKYSNDQFKQDLKVAQLNGNTMEYVKPNDVFKFDYNGKMYKLESQLVDFQVTVDHELYVKLENDKEFKKITANEAYGKKNATYLTYDNKNKKLMEIKVDNSKEELVDYKGEVYCLQIDSGVFMIRYNNKNHFTCNCSRHGKLFCLKAFKL